MIEWLWLLKTARPRPRGQIMRDHAFCAWMGMMSWSRCPLASAGLLERNEITRLTCRNAEGNNHNYNKNLSKAWFWSLQFFLCLALLDCSPSVRLGQADSFQRRKEQLRGYPKTKATPVNWERPSLGTANPPFEWIFHIGAAFLVTRCIPLLEIGVNDDN